MPVRGEESPGGCGKSGSRLKDLAARREDGEQKQAGVCMQGWVSPFVTAPLALASLISSFAFFFSSFPLPPVSPPTSTPCPSLLGLSCEVPFPEHGVQRASCRQRLMSVWRHLQTATWTSFELALPAPPLPVGLCLTFRKCRNCCRLLHRGKKGKTSFTWLMRSSLLLFGERALAAGELLLETQLCSL